MFIRIQIQKFGFFMSKFILYSRHTQSVNVGVYCSEFEKHAQQNVERPVYFRFSLKYVLNFYQNVIYRIINLSYMIFVVVYGSIYLIQHKNENMYTMILNSMCID